MKRWQYKVLSVSRLMPNQWEKHDETSFQASPFFKVSLCSMEHADARFRKAQAQNRCCYQRLALEEILWEYQNCAGAWTREKCLQSS
jgi:hypothetical protein